MMRGSWIHAFSIKISIVDVLVAELHALRFGLLPGILGIGWFITSPGPWV